MYKKIIILILLFNIFTINVKANLDFMVLEKGMKNSQVQLLQEKLNILGFDIKSDGIFGEETKLRVKSFQNLTGLSVDGVVGEKTWETLKEKITFNVYVVKPWDTLKTIADKFNIDRDLILKVNDKSYNELMKDRTKIIIPQTQVGGIYEGVKFNANKNLNEKRNYSKYRNEEFIYPLKRNYRIVSNFGSRISPFNNKKEFHEGIDIAVPSNNEVLATKSGVVLRSGWLTGFGKTITIDHDNSVVSLYAHNNKLLVKKGEKVKQGDVIALSGNTGRSTGSHLHFGIYIRNEAINPLNYLP